MTLSAVCGQDSQRLLWAWLSDPSAALTVPPLAAVPSVIVASSPEALTAFREFMHQVIRKYFDDNLLLMAHALGIHERSLRRTLSEDSAYTLSLEHCLSLATALRTHVSAATVFQKADKADSLKVMQALFGRSKLSAAEETLLQAWSRLTPAQQDQVVQYARFLTQQTSPKPKASRP